MFNITSFLVSFTYILYLFLGIFQSLVTETAQSLCTTNCNALDLSTAQIQSSHITHKLYK